jgi:hypothetical protein
MADFASSIGITPLLQNWGIDPNQNFEDVYSNLFEAGEHAKLAEMNQLVEKISLRWNFQTTQRCMTILSFHFEGKTSLRRLTGIHSCSKRIAETHEVWECRSSLSSTEIFWLDTATSIRCQG